MSGSNIQIEKLTKDNYDTWKLQMQAVLIKNDHWLYANGSKSKPGEKATEKMISEWNMHDGKAKADLILAMSPSELCNIKDCKTSNEVWTKLSQVYESKGPARKATLLKQLLFAKMSENGNMTDHLNKFFNIVDKLKGMNIEIADDLLSIVILYSIPSSYENFRCAIEARDELPKPELLKIKLLEECVAKKELRSKHDDISNASQAHFSKNNNWNHNDKRKFETNPNQKFSNNKRRKLIECNYCNKIGHIASVCWNKAENRQKFSASHVDEEKEAWMIAENYCSFQVRDTNSENVWCIDSGATSHMSYDIKNFSHLESMGESKVTLANNDKIEINGKGSTYLKVKNNEVTKEIELKDVLCVPKLKSNLLSVSKITNNGHSVLFTCENVLITDKAKNILAQGKRYGDLYLLTSNEESANVTLENNELSLWHRRFGHLNESDLRKLFSKELIAKIPLNIRGKFEKCEVCIKAKQTVTPFQESQNQAKRILEVISSDICGPMRVNSIGGSKYFCTFIDNYSRWVEVRFLKTKDQVKREFIKYQTIFENQKEKKIQILRTDNGLEYSGEEFNKHLEESGILHQKTVPYTPQQNGIAERMNRTLVEMARCMLLESTLPESFWAEAISTAAYIRNRSPTAILRKTPYEVWMNTKPNITHLRIFGQKVFALNKAPEAGKFSEKSIECNFLGYSAERKAYRLWNIKDKKIIERREVEFIDPILPSIIPNQDIAILENLNMDFENINDSEINESNSLDKTTGPIIENIPEPNITKKSLRNHVERSFNTIEFAAQVACSEITCPTVEEVLAGPHADEWTNAMKMEFDSLVKCKTWEKVTRPIDKNIIGCKWVLKTKYNPDGTVEKRKARLVAKGYAQIPGIDYEETFAPVARLGTIRLIISIAAKEDLELHQLDVVMAYINGDLNEQIYMEQPKGFVNSDEENLVCLLKKSLYGLKQSGRQWYEKLKNHLTRAGMIQSDYDKCLYYLKSNVGVLFLTVYVDDLIIATNNDSMLTQIKESLNSEFNMKNLGKLNYCLGIQFSQNSINNTITMSQQKYIDDILIKYKMTDANSVKTPLEPKIQLKKTDSNEEESNEAERNLYQSLIGSLMYLAVCTRPDLAYTVSTLSQFNQNPSQVHWSSAKRVLRYLIGTKNYGLTFTNTTKSLHGYVDSDWGSNINDRISQCGYIFKLGESSITWESRKQKCVALSSTEAEYVALSEAVKEGVYLKKILTEIGYMKPEEQIIIYCDNQGAQKLTKNSLYHSRTKHIDIKYHFIRKIYEEGELDVKYIPTNQMPADVLTKSLPIPNHEKCLIGLGINRL